MSDDESESERSIEEDGRHVRIDAGFYEVQVHGDPDDSLEDVKETAFEAADRARDDVEEMDDNFDNGDNRHHH